MRAILLKRTGGPDVCFPLRRLTSPARKGEVLVSVSFSGINYAEILSRKGLYGWAPKAPLHTRHGMRGRHRGGGGGGAAVSYRGEGYGRREAWLLRRENRRAGGKCRLRARRIFDGRRCGVSRKLHDGVGIALQDGQAPGGRSFSSLPPRAE